MKTIGGILLSCFIVITVSGCAGTSRPSQYALEGYTSEAEWSAARNVVNAGGSRDIRDAKSTELSKRRFYSGEKGEALGATSFAALSYISDLNQLGVATIPLSVVAWNAVGPRDYRALPRVFAWMPKEMASSPEDAKKILGDILNDALGKALGETEFPYQYKPDAVMTTKKLPGRSHEYTGYMVTGGLCDNDDTMCRYRFIMSSKSGEGDTGAVDGVAPDFLGGSDAWVFSRISTFRPLRSSINIKNQERPAFPDVSVYQATSKYLPEWVYLYLPNSIKSKMIFMGEGTKALGAPIVLNKGNALLFVSPDPPDTRLSQN